ncbi:MAG: FAD-dependent oxidoreductase [Deltaproteobacteria bacterium]|nr:FAD-dependent oxidoreductase [Deltaproteobacteria bacterium]
MATNPADSQLDIAVVGGGIAGIYCCLQLQKRLNDISSGNVKEALPIGGKAISKEWLKKNAVAITLYEASERLGGRIETWSIEIKPGEAGLATDTMPYGQTDGGSTDCLRAEFGPMRIEPREQPLLNDLLSYVGITEPDSDVEDIHDLKPFPSYAAEEPAEPKFTLRGEEAEQHSLLDLLLLAMLRICELINEQLEQEAERGAAKTHATAVWNPQARKYWRQFLGNSSVRRRYWKGELRDWISNLTENDYDTIRRRLKVNDVYLFDMGFWNLLSEVLSHLAVVRIRDWASYYHLIPENPNAAEWLIFWLRAFKTSSSLRGIAGGMGLMIHEAEAKLSSDPRIVIKKKHKLVRLAPDGGQMNLTFDVGAGRTASFSCHELFLALPKRPLEKLSLPTKQAALLNTVVGIPLLKAFFLIDQPWWEDNRPANRYAGDLPTRELHYSKSAKKTKGMIMVYTDRPATQFWTEYITEDIAGADKNQGGEIFYQRIIHQEAAKIWELGDRRVTSEYDTPNPRLWRRFVQYARDYEHNDFTLNHLRACGIRDWGKEPYGGACHAWRPGQKSWEVMDELEAFSLSGEKGKKHVHVCGEAYSDYQGFIEGSLRSTARVLERLGKAQPANPGYRFDAHKFLQRWSLKGGELTHWTMDRWLKASFFL